jgi:hypothetical protein
MALAHANGSRNKIARVLTTRYPELATFSVYQIYRFVKSINNGQWPNPRKSVGEK